MLARRQPITLTLPRVVPPDLSEVRATVAYVDPEGVIDDRRSFVLTPGGAPAIANVRFADTNDAARITAEAIFADGSTKPLAEEVRPDPAGAKPLDLVVLPVPQRPAAQFSVMLSDPLDELRSVLVDYEVRQAGQLVASAAVEVTEPLRAVPVTVVLPAPTPLPEVRLRERRIFDRGGIETLDFQSLTDGLAIVGVPAADVMEVTLRYLGPPMATLGVLGILVTLRYRTPDDDPEFRQTASLFVEAAEPARWVVRLKDRAARSFSWQATLMLQTGQQRALPEVTTENTLVLLQITA